MDYYIAWWNVENLFDVNNTPDRPEYLQNRLAKEHVLKRTATLDIFQITFTTAPQDNELKLKVKMQI